jgi:hypothetical protein
MIKPPKVGEIVYFRFIKGEKWRKGKIIMIDFKYLVSIDYEPTVKDLILTLESSGGYQYEVYFKSILPEGNHWRMKEVYFVIPN